jgi:outer membrane protein TolC
LALLLLAAALLGGCAVKPSPFTGADHAARLVADRTVLFQTQEPLDSPLTLSTAIARALAYNFDNRLAMIESVLQDKQLDVANLAMLPRLAANAGLTARGNELASSSVSYQTRQTTLEPSVSQQQVRFIPDLTLSWSVLDLGVSYFQAKQQADRYLVAKERRRRVVNNIVKEVTAAWWRASTAQRLLPLIEPVVAEAEAGLKLLQSQEDAPLQPVLPALEQQKSLLQLIAQLRKTQSDLAIAKAQLAALVNLPPARDFALAEPPAAAWTLPRPHAAVEELETLGLFLRPDLREEMYQERIDRNNVWKELIRYIPILSQVSSLNYDSNIYLVNNFWAEIGLRFTASLMSLVQGPKAYDAAKAQVEVAKVRRLAMTMAVLVQINLGYRQYLGALQSYGDAQALANVEEKILKVVTDGARLQAEPELERVRRQAQAIAAALERDKELAEAYRALGNLYFAVGADIVPPESGAADLVGLTAVVEESLASWLVGRFPQAPGLAETGAAIAKTPPLDTPTPRMPESAPARTEAKEPGLARPGG